MSRDAVGQGQKRGQPLRLLLAVEFHIHPTLGACNHGTHRNQQNVDQKMLDLTVTTRIIKPRKMLHQLLRRHLHLPPLQKENAKTDDFLPSSTARYFMRNPRIGDRIEFDLVEGEPVQKR